MAVDEEAITSMNYRQLGNTELHISEVSFGTWAIGGSWGQTDDQEALKGLDRAIGEGVNFFDTADVYGDGHAEDLLARAKGRKIPRMSPPSFAERVIFTIFRPIPKRRSAVIARTA